MLLANKLDYYKGKGREAVDQHIQTLQNVYQDLYWDILQPMFINKGKQKEDIIQDEEVLLYKPYDISSLSSSKTPLPDI